MKTLLAAAAVLGAMAIAVPAHADPRDGAYNPGYSAGRAAPVNDAYRGDDRGDYRGDYRGERRPDAYRGFSRDDLYRLDARIDRGVRSGQLTRREAGRLSFQLNDLRQRSRLYWRTDGVSWRERQDLDQRYARLQEAIRYQVRDNDSRWDGDNRGPRRY